MEETKELADRNEHMRGAINTLLSVLLQAGASTVPDAATLTDAVRQIAFVAADEVEHRARDYFMVRAELDDAVLERLEETDRRWRLEQRLEIAARIMAAWENGFFNQSTVPQKRAERALKYADALIEAASKGPGDRP